MAEEKCEKDTTCDTCNESSSCNQQEKEAHVQERVEAQNSPISNTESWL